MRTISLALACVLAVALGTGLARSGDIWVWPGLVIGAGVVLGVGLVLARGAQAVRGQTLAWAGLLVCAGLLRGASVSAGPGQLQAVERGVGARVELREFVVVGASEPGPRCHISLRDPRAGPWAGAVEVEAPAEVCPRSHGQRVAILSAALHPGWRDPLLGRDHGQTVTIDLGRAPVLWSRPAVPRQGARRVSERYWTRYWATVAALRQRAWTATRGDRQASLVAAAALGLRAALEPGERRRLRAAGLGHLIAVSGLHVALAAIWVSAVARRIAALVGASPRVASVCAWAPVWIYVGLTGGAPSAIRAAAMLTALELGVVVGRPSHGPTQLALVAAGMLLWQPGWLTDPGFGLSVAAMAAIVSAPRDLGVLALSWRISWATAPLSALYFDQAPLHGLVGNAVALPMFAMMMPLGLVACLFTGPVAELAMSGASLFAAPILDLAELLAAVPSLGPNALALAALGLRLAARGLARRMPAAPLDGESATSWRERWVPPRLVCWAALGVAFSLHFGQPPASDKLEFDWVALGTSRSYAVLTVDVGHERSACLHRPGDGAATWLALLERVGVDRLSRLDADLPRADGQLGPPRDDPRTRALGQRLRQAGVEVASGTEQASCAPVDRARVRAAIRACRFIQGGRPRGLVHASQGQVRCRVEDRWVPVAP